jgi:hypothetical protein
MRTMNKRRILLPAVLALSALVAGCSLPQANDSGAPQTWIDAPLNASLLPLAPYAIIAHAGFPEGISQFELSITAQGPEVVPTPADQASQSLVTIQYLWTPPAPGAYLIQVRAAGPDGNYGQTVEVQVQVGDESSEDVTPTPTPAAQACIWTAAVNIFVLQGPGTSFYPDIGEALAGETLPVVGQSQDGNFWAVQLPSGLTGYVPKAERFGQAGGDCDVRTLFDPPRPTATPRPLQCSDGLDNDGDGKVDYAPPSGLGSSADPQCRTADDDDELSP